MKIDQAKADQPCALSISQLYKRYDSGHQALKGVDLEVADGDFFALLGPNGAGKSTTIRIICSLTNKTSGNVKIYGHDIDDDFYKAKSYLGVVPQEFNFGVFETPHQIVSNQGGFYGLDRADIKIRSEEVLNQLRLWDKRNVQSRELSGGMKRRLMIARALIHKPKLLILDEPTTGVDIEIRRTMWDFLREINENGTTIILTTHYLEEAESLCRNIAIIDQGVVVENTSMRRLLNTLQVETYVFDLAQSMQKLPSSLDQKQFRLIDDSRLEVSCDKKEGINDIFMQLQSAGINVLSMRNKTNRLEELFMSIVNSSPLKDKSI